MFNFLSIISSYLGYINVNVKLKNRIYTVLGALGNLYLLYVALRFFANGFYFRGFPVYPCICGSGVLLVPEHSVLLHEGQEVPL